MWEKWQYVTAKKFDDVRFWKSFPLIGSQDIPCFFTRAKNAKNPLP
jgi:hypothetical protein